MRSECRKHNSVQKVGFCCPLIHIICYHIFSSSQYRTLVRQQEVGRGNIGGTSQTAANLDNKTIESVKGTMGGQITRLKSLRLFSEQAAPPVGLCECTLFLMWRTSVVGVFTPLLFFSSLPGLLSL